MNKPTFISAPYDFTEDNNPINLNLCLTFEKVNIFNPSNHNQIESYNIRFKMINGSMETWKFRKNQERRDLIFDNLIV